MTTRARPRGRKRPVKHSKTGLSDDACPNCGSDLRFIEERNGSALMPLAGHREDLLAERRMRRFRDRDIPKKRVNCGQARVPGPTGWVGHNLP